MKKSDKLQGTIETALSELLSGKSTLTAEEKEDKRKDLMLAIKWQSVKLKMSEEDWGSGLDGKGDNDDE